MGFDEPACREALKANDWNPDLALNTLLGGLWVIVLISLSFQPSSWLIIIIVTENEWPCNRKFWHQIDTLKLHTFGVKKPMQDKQEKINGLADLNRRYYPQL